MDHGSNLAVLWLLHFENRPLQVESVAMGILCESARATAARDLPPQISPRFAEEQP
jgi:hypothetical protein